MAKLANGKGFKFASLFALIICTAASCETRHSVTNEPHCGFADPKFTTSLGIWYCVADYYVTKHDWPLTRAQLEDQNQKILEENSKDMTPEEAKDFSGFVQRFTLLDLKKKGDDLVFHYQFNMDGKVIDQTITLVPRPTIDEILAAATDGHEN